MASVTTSHAEELVPRRQFDDMAVDVAGVGAVGKDRVDSRSRRRCPHQQDGNV